MTLQKTYNEVDRFTLHFGYFKKVHQLLIAQQLWYILEFVGNTF
jgi:hypothetical protein